MAGTLSFDPFGFVFLLHSFGIQPVEHMPAAIGRAGKDQVDRLNAPWLAAHEQAAIVERFGNLLHAHARAVLAMDIEGEDFLRTISASGSWMA